MSRGVVLWPDREASAAIQAIWDALAAADLPSLRTLTHRRHQPHCSLIVGDRLHPREVLDAVGPLPAQPVPLRIESIGIFPQTTMVLACVASRALLAEQQRVHEAARTFVEDEWPWYQPDRWVPHITLGMTFTPEQVAGALPIILDHLPIEGWFDQGGIEDGTSGDNWVGAPGSRVDGQASNSTSHP